LYEAFGKQAFERQRRWENNSEMYLTEIRCEDGWWMELAQDRVQWWALVLAVLNHQVLLPELVN